MKDGTENNTEIKPEAGTAKIPVHTIVSCVDLTRFWNQELNLEILAEEAAEIIQIKSKIIRFGLDDFHPKNKMLNRLKLEEEIGHLLAMVDILKHHGIITDAGINSGKKAKFEKLPKWYS